MTSIPPKSRIIHKTRVAPKRTVASYPTQRNRPLSANDFSSMVRGDVNINGIFRLYTERVAPFYESKEQVSFIRILMTKARWLNEERNDPASMLKIWTFILEQDIPRSSYDRVIRTMIEVANHASDTDLPAALSIWTAAYEIALPTTPKTAENILNNLIIFAQRYIGNKAKRIDAAIIIFNAVYQIYATPSDKESIIAKIMGHAQQNIQLRTQGIEYLGKTNKNNLDPDFYSRLVTGFQYYSRNYQAVIDFVNSQTKPNPRLTAIKADALRKDRKYTQAIRISNALIRRYVRRKDLAYNQARALIDALTCRGYCRAEKGKISRGTKILQDSVSDFELAIEEAKTYAIPIPPRAYTGMAYAYTLLGNEQKALEATQKALELNQHNKKALSDLQRLTPTPR